MSEHKIITFDKLALICKHKMGGCGLRMGSIKHIECSGDTCPIFCQLIDAEPIIEAAKYWLPHMKDSLNDVSPGYNQGDIYRIESALEAIGELRHV